MDVVTEPSHDFSSVPVAASFFRRFSGLMFRRRGLTLYFPRCRALHTCFMLTAIDLVFVDDSAVVTEIVPAARPWRVYVARKPARHVLELPPGGASGIEVGDRLLLPGLSS